MPKLLLSWIVLSFALIAAENIGVMGSSNLRGSTPTTLEHSAVLSNTSTTLWDVVAEDELDMINVKASEISVSQNVEINNITSMENVSISKVNLTRWWYCNRWYCRWGRCGGCRRLSTPTTPEHREDELDMVNVTASGISLSQNVEVSSITSVDNASISEVNLTRWWYYNRWYCRWGRCGGCRRLSTFTTLEHREDELDMITANASEISFNQDVKISNIPSLENASISEGNLTRW